MILLYKAVRNGGQIASDRFEFPELEIKRKPFLAEEIEPEEDPAAKLLEESRLKAQEMIETARAEAEELLQTAQADAEAIRRDAYEEGQAEGQDTGYKAGFEAGYEEGHSVFTKRVAELERQVGDYIEDVQTEKAKLLEKYMDNLKEIALAIGEKIVRTSLRSNARVIERMILAATERLKKSAWAKIYIGAQESAGTDIRADQKFLRELARLSDNVKIVMMEELEPGVCIVERPEETIDISVNTQLENIREIMNNARL